eukprot:g60427.t1
MHPALRQELFQIEAHWGKGSKFLPGPGTLLSDLPTVNFPAELAWAVLPASVRDVAVEEAKKGSESSQDLVESLDITVR